MYEKTAAECWWYDEERAMEAQLAFEATFPKGTEPKIDTRTPKEVEEQAILEGWH